MERLSEWLSAFAKPGHRLFVIPPDHAPDRASDHPRPVAIHQQSGRVGAATVSVYSARRAPPPLPQVPAVAVPRGNPGEAWVRDGRGVHGNCPPAARRTPCRRGAPLMSAPLAPQPRNRQQSTRASPRPISSCSKRLAESQIDAALAGQRVVSFGERCHPMIDEAIGTAPHHNITTL